MDTRGEPPPNVHDEFISSSIPGGCSTSSSSNGNRKSSSPGKGQGDMLADSEQSLDDDVPKGVMESGLPYISNNSDEYQVSCSVVSKPQHCFFHQGHLRGLRGPCPFGDKCFRKHAKEKVSQADFENLKLKVLGPPVRTSSLEFHGVCKEFALKGKCPNGMSQHASCQDGNHLTLEELGIDEKLG